MTQTTKTEHASAQSISADQIPIINISDLLASASDTSAILQIAQDIHSAARDVGFFYISGHAIPESLIENARAAAVQFFALDEELKEQVRVDTSQRGWMPTGMAKLEGAKTHDLKEVFFYGPDIAIDDPALKAGLPLVARNQWPDISIPGFREAIEAYYNAVCHVGKHLMSAIAIGFNQSASCFETLYRNPLARAQVVYYPESQTDDECSQRFGVAPHTDFGVLTLLYQDNSGGLQIQGKDEVWIEAPPIPGTMVCNIGDLLEYWTAGTFKSTVHRVINRSGGERYSLPVFYDPASDARIDPSLLGQPAAKNQKIVTAGEHIAGRNARNFSQYRSS